MLKSDDRPVAMVTGGSAGLGQFIAQTFLDRGYRVMIVGRDPQRINRAIGELAGQVAIEGTIIGQVADVTRSDQVSELIGRLERDFGRLDVLVNCVGQSDRGLVEHLDSDRLDILLQRNVHTALLCSQAALPLLESSRGVIVNIGSLASKVGARYIGGYAIAKHALAGMTQQMRLELQPRGVHVALVSPGPIRRSDAGVRYQQQVDSSLPDQASKPGGGTRLKGLDPQRVADAVFQCVRRRKPDVILPRHMRCFIAIGHALPRLGDWLLIKFTSAKPEDD
jgi:NAD(P)-dependent dehydrogenase (short-subunit alcohol dehydrogenase family)